MNTVRRIAKNTAVLFVSQIASYILGFFYIMYTARYLGAEGFGILSFALAFTGIFGVFSDLGLRNLTVREVARDKSLAGKYLGNIAVIKIILSFITIGLITITINLLGYPEQTIKVVYLIALSVVFGAFSGMFYSIFQAYEKMEYQSLGLILSSALMLAGVLIGIKQGFDVIGFASLYFLVNSIVLGYSFVVCLWKFVLPKLEVNLQFWKTMFKEALPFGLSSIFVVIYFYIDSVMLSIIKGDIEVGLYNAAYRIVYLLLFIPSIYFMAVYPVMSKLYSTSKNSLKISYEHSFKYMLFIIIPIAIGTTLLSNKIILLIFGNEYIQSVSILQILIWAVFCSYLSHTPTFTLNSINKQSIYTKVVFLCMVLNVVLNLILIPKWSYNGAGIATVITEFIAFILLFRYINDFFTNPFSISTIIKPTICGIIMAIFIFYSYNLNIFILIFLSAIIYFTSLILIGSFSKQDYLLMRAILNKPNNKKEGNH